MEGLLFFRFYPSDGFRFILIPDGNPSHEFPVLDGNPSSNMNSAILRNLVYIGETGQTLSIRDVHDVFIPLGEFPV
jgi:hypothetical protein